MGLRDGVAISFCFIPCFNSETAYKKCLLPDVRSRSWSPWSCANKSGVGVGFGQAASTPTPGGLLALTTSLTHAVEHLLAGTSRNFILHISCFCSTLFRSKLKKDEVKFQKLELQIKK